MSCGPRFRRLGLGGCRAELAIGGGVASWTCKGPFGKTGKRAAMGLCWCWRFGHLSLFNLLVLGSTDEQLERKVGRAVHCESDEGWDPYLRHRNGDFAGGQNLGRSSLGTPRGGGRASRCEWRSSPQRVFFEHLRAFQSPKLLEGPPSLVAPLRDVELPDVKISPLLGLQRIRSHW